MSWATERKAVISEAMGPRRFIAIGLVIAIFRGVQWVADEARAHGISGIVGYPLWLVGTLVGVLMLAWWLLEYAVRLHRRLTPTFSLMFNPSGGGLVLSPVKKHLAVHSGGQLIRTEVVEGEAVYIRGLVTAITESALTECSAYLTGVRKKDKSGSYMTTQYLDSLQLPWSIMQDRFITIPQGIQRYFDIVEIHNGPGDQPVPGGGVMPLTLRNLFRDHTTYELDVVVHASGISRRMTVEFTWTGDIKTVTGRQMPASGTAALT